MKRLALLLLALALLCPTLLPQQSVWALANQWDTGTNTLVTAKVAFWLQPGVTDVYTEWYAFLHPDWNVFSPGYQPAYNGVPWAGARIPHLLPSAYLLDVLPSPSGAVVLPNSYTSGIALPNASIFGGCAFGYTHLADTQFTGHMDVAQFVVPVGINCQDWWCYYVGYTFSSAGFRWWGAWSTVQ